MPHPRRRNAPLPFSRRLVLHRWLLDLFGVGRFDRLAEHLRDESLEGLDEDNVHRFHRALCLHLPAERRPALPDQVLLEHDQAIVSVTARLNERRITRGEPPIVWKYFQYLALLFTEIYLDRWFRDPRALLAALNARIAAFNDGKAEADRVSPFDEAATENDASAQLNKLAFWMATGSGKTLLMHAHVLRYRRLLMRHGRARDLNRILLLTPNEGLSRQHLREFEAAGIEAEIFSKESRGLFTGQAVEILEITKLRDEMGDRTVAVEAFEGNNLVLIDEGHRGAAAGEDGAWMRFRNALCEKGFSFEYSATFGQAVKGNPGLGDLYARGTLFDYSYRWFHGDGFGKDYRILNLEDDGGADWMATWLTACLLAFFQQQRLYREHEAALRPFNLERPLWIFVGGRVTATLAKRDASDIVEILRFTFRKHEWELPHLEYRALAEDDPNFPTVREERGEYGYRVLVEKSRQDVVAKLEALKAAIEAGDLKPWAFQGLSAVWFDRHLYQPLLALEGGLVEISPAPLNRGERRFVEDLKTYCDGNPAAFEGDNSSPRPGGHERDTAFSHDGSSDRFSQNQQEHAEHDHHHDGHPAGVPSLAEPSGRPEATVRPPSDAAPDARAGAAAGSVQRLHP